MISLAPAPLSYWERGWGEGFTPQLAKNIKERL